MPNNETKYVDGYVLVIPKDKVDDYRKMAEEGAAMWMKYGALNYKECMLDDPNPEHVTLTFPILTKAGDNETVWFSYIEFKSKAHRDEVNAKVMEEMDKQMEKYKDFPMPFDINRMSNGGFEVIVSGEEK